MTSGISQEKDFGVFWRLKAIQVGNHPHAN
jgi:hypothetical protein